MVCANLRRYEEDVHIPMFVRMPASEAYPASPGGIARKVEAPTLNIDIAPTLLDLAGFGATAVAEMDGQSIMPLLHATAAAGIGDSTDEPAIRDGSVAGNSGRAFMIEYFPIPHSGNDVQASPKGMDGSVLLQPSHQLRHIVESMPTCAEPSKFSVSLR